MPMTYEDYLNEVTTLIFEENDVTEQQAIDVVVAAQDALTVFSQFKLSA